MAGQGCGKRRPCGECGNPHQRKADICEACEPDRVVVANIHRSRKERRRQTEPDLALTGGHWLPGRHGILRYVT